MSNKILLFTDVTLPLLKQKHPESRESPPEIMREGRIRRVHPVVNDNVDEYFILKAATLTKGGSGPFGIDGDGWRRILPSREFGTSSTNTHKTFDQLIKRFYMEELETTTLLDA